MYYNQTGLQCVDQCKTDEYGYTWCDDSCYYKEKRYDIAFTAIIWALTGYPLDIYNIWMSIAPNSEEIAKSKTASLLNSGYMAGNQIYYFL